MRPEQWSQAKAWFSSLIEHEPAQWPALLSGERDPEVLEQVQRLLAAHATRADPLQYSAVESLGTQDALLGQSLGPFRIIELLGEGGGGRVYLAERSDVGGKAALKILRTRFANADARRRFQAEQSILARLDHPNIARLLQVGVTDDGTPWLAMEHVEGRDFNEAMAGKSIPDRVRMVIKLLGAVDYAHRQLVVHRDIKPGNILIDARGEPKLLDFGIAKRLDDAAWTRTQFQPRTPAYAAPEQIRGEPVSVATDVYALGVLLYETLSGRHPWLSAGADIDAAILAGEAALPSSWLSPAERRKLQGDLDAIVLQAMRVDPAQRYAGAAAMAEDLQRYLDHRPVRAQKQTWLYRSRRFVLRNARMVSAGVAVGLLLALALVHEHRLREAAAKEADRASTVAEFMLDVFAAGDSTGAGFTLNRNSTVMDFLARGAERLKTLESAPLVRADLAHSMGEVYWGYAEYGPAEELFKLAIDLRTRHLGPSDATAESYLMLGRVYERTSRTAQMLEPMQISHDMRVKVLGADHPRTIHSLHRIAAAHYQTQQLDRAAEVAGRAITSWRLNLPAHNLDLANSLTILSLSQLRMGQFEESLRSINEAMSLRAAVLPPEHNIINEAYTNRSRTHFAMGEVQLAIADLRHSLTINEKNHPVDHWDLVLQYEKLAAYLVASGEIEEAGAIADKAVAMADRMHLRTPNPELVDLARHAKALVLQAQSQLQQALELSQAVIESRQVHLPKAHSNLVATRSLHAELLLQTGATEQALEQLSIALVEWALRPFGFIPELDQTMRTFAEAGHCDWLQSSWPTGMSARMAQSLARDRKTCG